MNSSTSESPRPVARSAPIEGQLASLRRKFSAVAAFDGVAIFLSVGIGLFVAQMLGDWWIEFPWGLRVALLTLDALVLGFILVRWTLLPLLRPPDDEEAALLAERHFPEFRTRLIAAVQLSDPRHAYDGDVAEYVNRTVADAEKAVLPLRLTQSVPTRKLRRHGLIAAMLLLLGASGFVYGRAVNVELLQRLLLARIPVPRKTRVVWTTGDIAAGRGDTVRIEARAAGIIPRNGRLLVKYASGQLQELMMDKTTNANTFARALENVPESFSYHVQLNDGRSTGNRVTILARPSVVSVDCVQTYPSYARLDQTARSAGDLNLLIGSRLQVKVKASKEIVSASLRLVGINRQIPLTIDQENSRQLTGEFAVASTNLAGFSVQLRDRDGMESKDGAVYRIDVLPDKRPTIRLLYPERKEELATRNATILLSYEAEDDFAVARAALHFRVGSDKRESVTEFDLAGEKARVIRHRFDWALSSIAPPLKDGSVVEFWITAADNNDVTGPGVGQSDHYQIRIVSPDEKRTDLMQRAGDFLGTIGDLTTEQEKLNENLGTLIRARINP